MQLGVDDRDQPVESSPWPQATRSLVTSGELVTVSAAWWHEPFAIPYRHWPLAWGLTSDQCLDAASLDVSFWAQVYTAPDEKTVALQSSSLEQMLA